MEGYYVNSADGSANTPVLQSDSTSNLGQPTSRDIRGRINEISDESEQGLEQNASSSLSSSEDLGEITETTAFKTTLNLSEDY